ncbi:hypothetical protein AMS68_000885 [Peltaster fructicola]|uniref:Uncharacterized protein n=1 Tax=Peltaster fructicola TaxID=286661 RepID=A0A6H0XL57_9PEZI|nr:hypothetical protein AMS68_000885 [Peltaster fructicola]
MDHIKRSYKDSPKLNKKQSWFGKALRNVVAQGALTAKAAVDSVRERIAGSTMPELPNNETSNNYHTALSLTDGIQTPRHRRTISAKSTLSSIRAHLPRRSIDNRRHSIQNLLPRSESYSSRRKGGPEVFYTTSPHRATVMLAATIPLPSSPIDVPGKAPSLSLDLGSSQLISPASQQKLEDARHDTPTRKDLDCLTPLYLPTPLLHAVKGDENMVPDPLQPVLEVRRSSGKLEQENMIQHADGWVTINLESPLPGTNAHIELDDNCVESMMIKELACSPTRQLSTSRMPLIPGCSTDEPPRPLNARARSINAKELLDELSGQTTSQSGNKLLDVFIAEHIVDISVSSGILSEQKIPQDARSIKPSLGLIDSQPVQNSGPPSPERRVRLPMRPKLSIDTTTTSLEHRIDSPHEDEGSSTPKSATLSVLQESLGEQHTPIRCRGAHRVTDVAAAILRERTDDHLLFLDRMVASSADSSADISTTSGQSAGGKPATPSPLRRAATLRSLQPDLSSVDADIPLHEARPVGHQIRRHRFQSSSPCSSLSSPSRFSPLSSSGAGQALLTAASSSSSNNTPQHQCAIHNRFSLLANSDDMLSDEEDDDI